MSALNKIDRYARPAHYRELDRKAAEARAAQLAEAERQQRYRLEVAENLENWLASPVGGYFSKRIDHERNKLLAVLTNASINSPEAAEAQSRVRSLNYIEHFMAELLTQYKHES